MFVKSNFDFDRITAGLDELPKGWNKKSLAQRRKGAKDRRRMTEDGGQRAEVGSLGSVIRSRESPRLNTLEGNPVQLGREVRKQGKRFGDLRFYSTFDIIEAVEGGLFPDKVIGRKTDDR